MIARIDSDHPDPAQDLFDACAAGNLSRVQTLLQDPSTAAIALTRKERPYQEVTRSFVNLRLMVLNATQADSSAPLLSHLFAFAQRHADTVSIDEIIDPETMAAALRTGSLDVLEIYVDAEPDAVNMSFGIGGDPLLTAIAGRSRTASQIGESARVPIVRYLLKQGADPNHQVSGWDRPGRHINAAARSAPPEVVELLLRHGAEAARSGAAVVAAEMGRLNVLELLREKGVDMREVRGERTVSSGNKEEDRRRWAERPIDAARRAGREDVVQWLLQIGVGEIPG
ncbi:hypothetical protein F5Y15DRAFT_389574 [Xylariaceae sp. FL0016]|nr:hypothetical protein F5Y15DRAFT_389574 [Xylariaceae sp. FL0016]